MLAFCRMQLGNMQHSATMISALQMFLLWWLRLVIAPGYGHHVETTQAARQDQANQAQLWVEKTLRGSQMIFAGHIMQTPHQKNGVKRDSRNFAIIREYICL
jgi:hypothetical protein